MYDPLNPPPALRNLPSALISESGAPPAGQPAGPIPGVALARPPSALRLVALPACLVTVADGNKLVAPANPNRSELLIRVIGDATTQLYLKGSKDAINDGKNYPIFNNETVTLNLAGELWVQNAGGSIGGTIYVAEMVTSQIQR